MRYLPGRKICGCRVGEEDSELKKKFSRASTGHRYYHTIDTMIECQNCSKVYFKREEFYFPKQVHPVWHEWSKEMEIERKNQMGMKKTERRRIYHDDYTKSFEWCEPSHIENMRRGDDVDPDRVFHSTDENLDNLTTADSFYNLLSDVFDL